MAGPALAQALANARARLGRSALVIYAAAALVSLVVIGAALVSDRVHEEAAIRERLEAGTTLRAEYLDRHLALLTRELARLGLRSELDLRDDNPEPERELLELSHDDSAFFDVGVAILGPDGKVLWSQPETFLSAGTSFADESWFGKASSERRVSVVPVDPDREDANVYVVSPVLREGRFAGALVGAIDIDEKRTLVPAGADLSTTIATRSGDVIYPPRPPAWSHEGPFRTFVAMLDGPTLARLTLHGEDRQVSAAPVGNTGLVLLSQARADLLYAPARHRMWLRLCLALVLLVLPFLLLVWRLRRVYAQFRTVEDEIVRADRIRLVGEAANSIAHEVKNALNGIRVGLDHVLLRGRGDGRVVDGLRSEIERLSEFSSELLLFSRGASPRICPVDLAAFTRKVTDLQRDLAEDHGVELEIHAPDAPVEVQADPALVHVILSNLINNAIEAFAAGGAEKPVVSIHVGGDERAGRIEVRDNGPGLPDSVRGRLFEPFVTGKPSGVGIGLSLSRNLARAHGGDLVLVPTANGASFEVELPRAEVQG